MEARVFREVDLPLTAGAQRLDDAIRADLHLLAEWLGDGRAARTGTARLGALELARDQLIEPGKECLVFRERAVKALSPIAIEPLQERRRNGQRVAFIAWRHGHPMLQCAAPERDR